MQLRFALTLAALAALAVADCKNDSVSPLQQAGIAKCPTGTEILTVTPLPLTAVKGWVPLGNLNPVAHTFPTDHQCLYYVDPSSPQASLSIPLRAPATG